MENAVAEAEDQLNPPTPTLKRTPKPSCVCVCVCFVYKFEPPRVTEGIGPIAPYGEFTGHSDSANVDSHFVSIFLFFVVVLHLVPPLLRAPALGTP